MNHAAAAVLLLCLAWDINTLAAQSAATTSENARPGSGDVNAASSFRSVTGDNASQSN